jgi:hypothetical protein
MNDRELHHMYHARMQGNENYVRDWAKFVEWAAQCNSTTGDVVMRELQKHVWFKWGDQ